MAVIPNHPSVEWISREFVRGLSVRELCNKYNLSVDVVEDALRDQMKEWRFKARQKAPFKGI